MKDRPGRTVIRTREAQFDIYDLDGPQQPELSILPLSYDKHKGCGTYLMRFDRGAVTLRHTHDRKEEFLVLEGHLIDDDGVVFGPGDHVAYAPGTSHNSGTEDGCLILAFEWD